MKLSHSRLERRLSRAARIIIDRNHGFSLGVRLHSQLHTRFRMCPNSAPVDERMCPKENSKFDFVTRGHVETCRVVGSCLFLLSDREEREVLTAQLACLKIH